MFLGDKMKKTFMWIMFALFSGALLGKITFDKYENVEIQKVININDQVYMLKYKEFGNVDQMADEVIELDRYVYIEKEDMVTTYIGIFATKENAIKLKEIYDKKGFKTSIVKQSIDNEEFIQNLNEYEKLLTATEDENSLLIIQKQILSCYEDLVVEHE